MSAKCINCGKRIVWSAMWRRYEHKDDGSAFCGSFAMRADPDHACEQCGKPGTDCYREGSGTGHSEHVCACADHAQLLDQTPGLGAFFGLPRLP